jgi:hypothetical protein
MLFGEKSTTGAASIHDPEWHLDFLSNCFKDTITISAGSKPMDLHHCTQRTGLTSFPEPAKFRINGDLRRKSLRAGAKPDAI